VDREGLLRSSDRGRAFERVTGEITGHQIAFGRAAPGARHPAIYVAGRRGDERGVFRSTDDGATWLRLNPENLQFHSISALAADPRVFGRVYVGSRGRGIFYGEPAK
jgi:xyloglucan-specific exo-beta-1,4-glucanase